jgi:predicted transcriptional regulator
VAAKRRCKDEIIFEILKTCNGRGVKITKIEGSSNLNSRFYRKFINFLVENELIEVVKVDAILYKQPKRD